jgi:putative transposase
VARCVRRAFLCGEDSRTGQSYEHRKPWIVDKLKELTGIFAIDVCAYAVMSNHYHVVLRVDSGRAQGWSDKEVISRWRQLFRGGVLVERVLQGEAVTVAERNKVAELAAQWRGRLSDISWFMRCLNESIARQANQEDGCKGRFWEGWFKSQALLDERALLACMVYVDLNPVRAGIADTPETSDYTSLQARIRAYAEQRQPPSEREGSARLAGEARLCTAVSPKAGSQPPRNGLSEPLAFLLPFRGGERLDSLVAGIPFTFADWTGRAIREDKRGFIPEEAPPILARLGIDENGWVETVRDYGRHFGRVVGSGGASTSTGEALGSTVAMGLEAERSTISKA